MVIGLVLCIVVGLLAATSCSLSAIELGRIYSGSENHPCYDNGPNNIKSQCEYTNTVHTITLDQKQDRRKSLEIHISINYC